MGRPEGLAHAAELAELLAEAQRTALESTHAAVTIEHLLLAFVDSAHAKVLLQVDAAGLMALRGQIVSRLMQADGDPTTFGRVPPQDPALTDVLQAAERRARTVGLHLVDTTSVVAALLEATSPVASWLHDLGISVATPPPRAEPPAAAPLDGAWPSPTPTLPAPPDDEDDQDSPTEEATMPADELEGPASLVTEERATDPAADDDIEEWAAPTKVAGGLERERLAAERAEAERAAKERAETERATAQVFGKRPSLDGGESFMKDRAGESPEDWNHQEFDDEVPTVAGEATTRADEEPTRVKDESTPRRTDPTSSLTETLDRLEAEERVPPVAARPPDVARNAPANGAGAPDYDVDELSVPPPPPVPDIAAGRLAENIPRRMTVDRPESVQVRLGKDGTVDLRKGMRGAVTTHQIVVTQAMSARLVAPDGGFLVELTSPETQWIDDPAGLRGTPAEWTWTLTPTKAGKRTLQLVVGARTIHEGIVADAALPMQTIEIEVSNDHSKTLARGLQWLALTLFGAVLGVFSEDILRWIQGVIGAAP